MVWNTWAIDGDVNTQVKHPASLARLQSFVAFESVEGVVNPLDMRVMALDVPGTAIRVMPGAGAVLNRAAGVQSQAYTVELAGGPDEKQVTATDSGGGRSDLVVVRVENPFLAGENFGLPPDPSSGPYTYVRIIPGVPPGTIDYHQLTPGTYGDVTVSSTDSAITLARIDIPASTATIQQSYIKDLRSMAQMGGRRADEEIVESNPWIEVEKHVDDRILYASDTSYKIWPSDINWRIPVPEWATAMECIVQIDAFMRDAPTGTPTGVFGDCLPVINGSSDGYTPTTFDWNWVKTGGAQIVPIRVLGTLPIPAALRGTIITFRVKARMRNSEGCLLEAGGNTYSTGTFQFKKYPVYS